MKRGDRASRAVWTSVPAMRVRIRSRVCSPRAITAAILRSMTRTGLQAVAMTAIASFMFATPAYAQVEDSSVPARRALIEAAQLARDAGDRGRALDLALRAGRLGMTPSLRRFIAEEQSVLGEHVAAMTSASLCVSEVERDATLLDRDEHLARCSALVQTLSMHVGSVILQIPEPAPRGLRVRIGGRELPDGLWRAAYVVVPGPVAIDAETPDGRTFHRDVRLRAGDAVRVPIDLPLLQTVGAPDELTGAAGTGTEAPRRRAEAARRATRARETSQSIGPWFVLGGSVVALGAAGILAAVPRDASDTRFTIAAGGALVLGGVALVAAVAWWLAGRAQQTRLRGSFGATSTSNGAEIVYFGVF